MRCFVEQLRYLLEQVASAPDKPIGNYSLLTSESRSTLPNPRVVLDEPPQEPVTSTFASRTLQNPDRVAIRQCGRSWSYGELQHIADRLAGVIRAVGLERGDVVAIVGPRSFGLVAALIAVLRSGYVALPIDPSVPTDRQRTMLREAKARALLSIKRPAPTGADQLELSLPGPSIAIEASNGHILGRGHFGRSEVARLPEIAGDDRAYIFFTSGTTGVPKAILGCHKGLSHFLRWQRETFGIGPQDRVAQLSGVSFDVLLRDVFLPLTSGGTLCLLPSEGLTSADLLRWLDAERVSVLHVVPTLAESWLADRLPDVTLEALRWLFLAGEPLKQTTVRHWREIFGTGCQIVNLYGPTETTMVKCFYRVSDPAVFGVQPLGRPLPQTQALVLSENGRLCGIGEQGEIVLRTPFGTLGYLNAPEGNKKSFRQNPFRDAEHDRVYFTGDRGRYRPDGLLEFLGRVDDQVKIRGIRIELGEIEAVLAKHPAVKAVVTVVHEDETSDKRLVSYVVSGSEQRPRPDELRAFLKTKLPQYMLPSRFVFLEALPLTPNGKIDRRALPVPELSQEEPDGNFLAPSTAMEAKLAAVWQQVLGIERVGVRDNFFDLGGHSLLSIKVISRLERQTGLGINPGEMMVQNLGQLAAVYEEWLRSHPQRRAGGSIRKFCRKVWTAFVGAKP